MVNSGSVDVRLSHPFESSQLSLVTLLLPHLHHYYNYSCLHAIHAHLKEPAMDREAAFQGSPLHLPPSSPDPCPPFTTPSLSAPARTFKFDEGYSDETKSPSDQGLNPSSSNAMTLPDWMLAQSEHDRAGSLPRPSYLGSDIADW